MPSCLKLLRHWIRLALSLALAKAGNSIAARMAMMAITTSNSMRVKAGGNIAFVKPRTLLQRFRVIGRIKTIHDRRRIPRKRDGMNYGDHGKNSTASAAVQPAGVHADNLLAFFI